MSDPEHPSVSTFEAAPQRHESHHAARSWFGVAVGLAFAVYLLHEVHEINVQTKTVGTVVIFAAWAAALVCLVVGLRDAGKRGRMSSLYYAVLPVFAHVMLFHLVNEDFGGAGSLAIVGWIAAVGLVGLEIGLLVTGRSRGGPG